MRSFFHYDNAISLALMFLLFFVVLRSINLEFLDPISDAFSDMELTDIVYSRFNKNDEYRVIEKGELVTPDTNVVIVNIGLASRMGISEMVYKINQQQPRVIAIDVFFSEENKEEMGDMVLKEVLSEIDNLVLFSEGINYDHQSNTFEYFNTSQVDIAEMGQQGFMNLLTVKKSGVIFPHYEDEHIIVSEGLREEESLFNVCRQFVPVAYSQQDGLPEYAFATKVCQLYDPASVERLLERGNQFEYINYFGNIDYYETKPRYRVIDFDEMFRDDFADKYGQLVKGKIVLLGFMGRNLDDPSSEDRFYTPLNDHYVGKSRQDMYGVVIHANIISMILAGNYINVMPLWLGHLLGFLLTYITFALCRQVYNNAHVWYDGITKLFVIFLTSILLMAVGAVFMQYNYKVTIHALYFVAIILSGDFLEIYYGFLKNILISFKNFIYLRIVRG